jgi:hypothetical protein
MKADSRHKKPLMILGVIAIAGVGWVLYKRRQGATTSSAPSLPSNNAVVSAETATAANPTTAGGLTLIPNGGGGYNAYAANGNNGQGNYGVDSNSSYMQTLGQEAALTSALATYNSTGKQTGVLNGPTAGAYGGG